MAKRTKHDLDLRLAGAWRRDDESFVRWTLRAGTERFELLAEEATGKALVGLLAALPATLERYERESAALEAEVEAITRERDTLARQRDTRGGSTPDRPPPPSAPAKPAGKPAALADVPLDMIGTFTVSPQMKSAAKKDPLLALAVQVAKALESDASPLEQARLRAMATAISRGDLDTFWAASTERSRKKLGS